MIQTKNIALVGMPGSSKTTTGKMLAEKLNREFIDTDIVYEEKYGETIAATFAEYGEEVFRKRETEVLKACMQRTMAIIATGGGIVLKQENRNILKEGQVIWLQASLDTIFERVKNDTTRPLLEGLKKERITQLYQERKELYAEAADIVIATDGKITEQIADEIYKNL